MSEVKVNKVTPRSGTTVQVGEAGDTVNLSTATVSLPNSTVTSDQLSGSIVNGKLANSSITINGSAVSLGGSVTIGETKPTITGISPSVITNDATNITITGANYVNTPIVEAVSSTGVITSANSVSFTSSTSITANFTLATDGTYFIRIENNDGNAVRSGTAILTVSDVPSWTTSAGSLGSFGAAANIGTVNLTATNSTGMAVQSGSLPGGITLNSAAGTSTLTGTETGSTQDTTYSFTIRATDAEGQTADRAFTMTIAHAASNSMGFN